MNILIVGGAGLLGSAVKTVLQNKAQSVKTAGRSNCDVHLDFSAKPSVENFRELVRGFEIVINCAGILIERGNNTFDAVHAQGPAALFKACELEHTARIVHVSALGAGLGLKNRYIQSKEAAELALAQCKMDWVCVRPGLLLSSHAIAYKSFAALAQLPVLALPGWRQPGESRLHPMAVTDAAQAIANITLHPKAHARSIEVAGPRTLAYRELIAAFAENRNAFRFGLPWWLMLAFAAVGELAFIAFANPSQKTALSRDGLRMLRADNVSERNEIQRWLGAPPQTVEQIIHSATSSNTPTSLLLKT